MALVVRIAAAGWAHDFPVRADPADYARHAVSIAHGHGYPRSTLAPDAGPTALRPPAWPYLLGAVFAASGDSLTAARVLQAFLGALAVALTGVVAWQLWGRKVAFLTAAIAAVYPPWILLDVSLFSEPLFMVFVLGAFATVLHSRRSSRPLRWIVVTGVLSGLAILTRENGALLLLPLAALSYRRGGRPAAALPIVLLVCAALTVAPWTVRNALVMHHFIPVSTQSGFTLAGTYNNVARTDRVNPAAWRPANLDPAYARLILSGSHSEVAVNRRLESHAIRYIRGHPSYVFDVLAWNVRRLFQLGTLPFARQSYAVYGPGRRAQDLAIFSFYPLALLALAGLVLPPTRRVPRALWAAPVLLLSVLFIESGMRFRAPVDAFVMLPAGVALAALADRVRARANTPIGAGSRAARRVTRPASGMGYVAAPWKAPTRGRRA